MKTLTTWKRRKTDNPPNTGAKNVDIPISLAAAPAVGNGTYELSDKPTHDVITPSTPT